MQLSSASLGAAADSAASSQHPPASPPSAPYSAETTRQNIGIALAVGGNLLVSIALNLTKAAHNENQRRAVPLPYVRLPMWWCGFAATLLGEMGNFAAYGFTEASVIAPLGAVSVLANAFIASLALGEGLRVRDLAGCALCAAGGIIIVLSTPAKHGDMDEETFMQNARAPLFVIYMFLLTAVVMVMLSYQERYGRRHVGYFVLLCSLLGSVTVMACKGVSTFVNLWLSGATDAPFGSPTLYVLLFVLVATAVLQIRYLNLAMEHFGNTETVPVYYVLFTVESQTHRTARALHDASERASRAQHPPYPLPPVSRAGEHDRHLEHPLPRLRAGGPFQRRVLRRRLLADVCGR